MPTRYTDFQMSSRRPPKSYTFVIMANVCQVPHLTIQEQFDMKGSTFGRITEKDQRERPGAVLKDQDFTELRGRIGVGPYASLLRRAIASDCAFLKVCVLHISVYTQCTAVCSVYVQCMFSVKFSRY